MSCFILWGLQEDWEHRLGTSCYQESASSSKTATLKVDRTALSSVVAAMASCKLCWLNPNLPALHTPSERLKRFHSSIIRTTHLPKLVACCDSKQIGDLESEREEGIDVRLDSVVAVVGRREVCNGAVAAAALFFGRAGAAEAYTQVEVGAYLPPAKDNSEFVQFKASTKDTPALRAGNVQPYEFILPPTWKQVRIANILSGNYCQPKCAEPWVEVKFENSRQGTLQVVASPMVRLSNKPNATIEEIGNPDKIISALGPFVTGNSYDPDEVLETSVDQRGNQTAWGLLGWQYYSYRLETPFALTGTHNLATATARGNVVLLFVVSANDAQWASSQRLLKTILESFTA